MAARKAAVVQSVPADFSRVTLVPPQVALITIEVLVIPAEDDCECDFLRNLDDAINTLNYGATARVVRVEAVEGSFSENEAILNKRQVVNHRFTY